MAKTVGIPVRPDGEWAFDYLSGLTAGEWRQWMDDRLRGRDRRVAYRPDEYPESASDIFMHAYDLAQDQVAPDVTDRMSEAAASLVQQLSSDSEDYWVLYHAIDLVGYLRAASARPVLAGWIRQEKLLQPDRWPQDGAELSVRLHRAALTSLAVLQVRDDRSFGDIWTKWFALFDRPGYSASYKYAFVASAFIGLAHMETTVLTDQLRQLLELEEQAREEGIALYISHAVLALYDGEPPIPALTVRRELVAFGWTDEEWHSLMAHTQNSRHALPERELIRPLQKHQKKTKSELTRSTWSDALAAG
jgi:hypothetical protein